MEKSPDAFRTISEVSDDLDLPQHVLRFWETRFQQIRPLKRAGGRRYYRPADIVLLRAIRQLLYDEGYTIKGVQRLLKEQGAKGLGVPDLVVPIEPRFGDRADEGAEDGTTHEDRSETRIDPSLSPHHDSRAAEPRPGSLQGSSDTMVHDDPQSALDAIHEALGLVDSCLAILEAVRPRRA